MVVDTLIKYNSLLNMWLYGLCSWSLSNHINSNIGVCCLKKVIKENPIKTRIVVLWYHYEEERNFIAVHGCGDRMMLRVVRHIPKILGTLNLKCRLQTIWWSPSIVIHATLWGFMHWHKTIPFTPVLAKMLPMNSFFDPKRNHSQLVYFTKIMELHTTCTELLKYEYHL